MNFRIFKLGMIANLIFLAFAAGAASADESEASVADIKKGDVMLGFSGNLSFSNYGYGTSKYLFLNNSTEWFVMDNLSIGPALNFVHGFGDNSSTGFRMGPSATYYVPMGLGKAIPFLSAGVLYGYSSGGGFSISTQNQLGVAYFLNPNIALRTSLEYDHSFSKSDGAASSSNGAALLMGVATHF